MLAEGLFEDAHHLADAIAAVSPEGQHVLILLLEVDVDRADGGGNTGGLQLQNDVLVPDFQQKRLSEGLLVVISPYDFIAWSLLSLHSRIGPGLFEQNDSLHRLQASRIHLCFQN